MEHQQPILLDVLDAPEVDRLPQGEAVGVTTSTPEPRAAGKLVEQASQLPEEFAGVPALVATDAAYPPFRIPVISPATERLWRPPSLL